jgi:hypothetical protein
MICNTPILLRVLILGLLHFPLKVTDIKVTAFTVAICGERDAATLQYVLSVFGTGCYSCYLWVEGNRGLQYYLCLELAFTVVICGERGAGAGSVVRV